MSHCCFCAAFITQNVFSVIRKLKASKFNLLPLFCSDILPFLRNSNETFCFFNFLLKVHLLKFFLTTQIEAISELSELGWFFTIYLVLLVFLESVLIPHVRNLLNEWDNFAWFIYWVLVTQDSLFDYFLFVCFVFTLMSLEFEFRLQDLSPVWTLGNYSFIISLCLSNVQNGDYNFI